jgi:hypothetical protein
MAQGAAEANDGVESPAVGSGSGKKSMAGKFVILGFIIGIVGLECTVAYLFIPSSGNASTRSEAVAAVKNEEKGESKAEAKKEAKKESKEPKHEKKGEAKVVVDHEEDSDREPADQVEVVLGDFSVTAFQPATNTTLRIEFNLFGTVGAGEQKEFLTSLEENQHRFREQVIVIVRSAEITDLTDAGLGLIKRKILEKTNRMIGKPFLRSIIFSDFSFIEQ